MNRFVASAFAAVLGAGAAQAADYRLYEPVPPYGAPVSVWPGAYFGANVGWGSGDLTGEASVLGTTLRGSLDATGALGGVHAGYNFLSGLLLYGVEADIQLAGISGKRDLGPAGVRGELKWFSTLRGRIGLASDEFLLYGTAGVALGSGKASAHLGPWSGSRSKSHVGWTLGAGAEMALNQEISVRLEYLYADFGRKNYLSDFGIDSKAGLVAHIFRLGATAHF